MAKGLFDCTGKVTLVTGGNGGIGLGFAMGCARMGGDIAIWARNAEKNAAAKAQLLEAGAGIRCNNLPTLSWKLDQLLNDPQRFATMQANARKLARPNAAHDIVAKLQ